MSVENLIDGLSKKSQRVSTVKPEELFSKWFLAAAIYAAILVLIIGIREDFSRIIEEKMFILEIVFAFCTILSASYSAFAIGVPDIERKNTKIYLFILPLLMLGGAIYFSGDMDKEAVRKSIEDEHFTITLSLILYSILPVTYFFKLLKKLAPTNLGLIGFLVIISTTALAHLIVRITVVSSNVASVIMWCYLPIILLSFGGIYLGKKYLRW